MAGHWYSSLRTFGSKCLDDVAHLRLRLETVPSCYLGTLRFALFPNCRVPIFSLERTNIMAASLANLSFAAFLVAHLFAVIAVPKIKFSDDQPSSTGAGILPQKDRGHTAWV